VCYRKGVREKGGKKGGGEVNPPSRPSS